MDGDGHGGRRRRGAGDFPPGRQPPGQPGGRRGRPGTGDRAADRAAGRLYPGSVGSESGGLGRTPGTPGRHGGVPLCGGYPPGLGGPVPHPQRRHPSPHAGAAAGRLPRQPHFAARRRKRAPLLHEPGAQVVPDKVRPGRRLQGHRGPGDSERADGRIH